MLTKDLIRCRKYKGKVCPQFINVEDLMLIQLANQLISAYKQETPATRSKIEEYTVPVINTADDVILAKGLNKLLLDRSEFSHEEGMDYYALRKSVFLASGNLLKQKAVSDYEEYRETLFSCRGLDMEFLNEGTYPDLPENECLTSFKTLSASNLLKRYNCSLVQSLLLSANSISLLIKETKAAKIRQMFKYLKFFRLLSKITRENSNKLETAGAEVNASEIRVVIDGPLSLFENTQKYGLQLASFFPTVCHLDKWKLEAKVKYRGKHAILALDQTSKLSGHYNHYGSYVPEEIGVFQKDFQSKVENWTITEDTPFLASGNQELIFPDFSFRNKDKMVIHLELFHRWHATQLLSRIKLGEKKQDMPLLIGVDRNLYKNPDIKEKLDKSSWFTVHGFLFNTFPGVERVHKCLKLLAKKRNK